MLDLSRCRNLLEFEFGQSLDDLIGSMLEPVERPPRTPIVATVRDWHSLLCIHQTLEGCSPSFMLASVAQMNLQSQGWKDAPLSDNVVAVHIELDAVGAHAADEDAAQKLDAVMSASGWLSLRFTARDIRTDARACAREFCDRFFERQTKVMDHTFMRYLEWRASCLTHPCATVRRAQNRQKQRPSARCLPQWNEELAP